MSTRAELLMDEVLQLSTAERTALLERLIASLDVDPEIDEAWAAEVERRHVELENGSVQLQPGPENDREPHLRISMTYRLHPEAETDLREAARFYRDHATASLSRVFLAEFKRSANLLVTYPRLGALWKNGRRRLVLTRFP